MAAAPDTSGPEAKVQEEEHDLVDDDITTGKHGHRDVIYCSFGQYFRLFAKSWTGAASFEGGLETRSGTVDLVQDDTCHCDSEPMSCDLILWKIF